MSLNISEEISRYLEEKDEKDWEIENFYKDERERLVEDIERKGDEIERLRLNIRIFSESEKRFISSITKILDSIDWFSHIASPLMNDALALSIENTWKRIRKELTPLGFTVINKKGEIFDDTIHTCIDVVDTGEMDDNTIYEVITPGYMYKGNVIKSAQVIVCKK